MTRIFLDLGTHMFEGLNEFTKKLNLGLEDVIYCFEPNSIVFNETIKNDFFTNTINEKVYLMEIISRYKTLHHYNKAVMDYTGKLEFNTHIGATMREGHYLDNYRGGSNALNFNPTFDIGNGAKFNIKKEIIECIDIKDILKEIENKYPECEIYIKIDIEGSEFKIIPEIFKSNNVKNIKEVYVEWHERYFKLTNQYSYICNLKKKLIQQFADFNIKYYEHH